MAVSEHCDVDYVLLVTSHAMYISKFKMVASTDAEEHDPKNKPTLLKQFIV